jgi:hypothetical protein
MHRWDFRSEVQHDHHAHKGSPKRRRFFNSLRFEGGKQINVSVELNAPSRSIEPAS